MNVHPMKLRNARSSAEWAKLITDAWNKSLDSIFETGDALIGAKDGLKHGEWIKMVERELPFNRVTAHKLMTLAGDDRLRDVSRGKHLPASWTTLYAIHRLSSPVIDASFEAGTIHPKLERKDVKFLPDLPYHEPKQAKKPNAKPNPIAPIDECVMHVRRTVFETVQGLSPEERASLFAELRAEIDDLEKKS